MGVKVHMIPVDPVTRKVDVRRVDKATYACSQYFSHITFPYICQSEIPTQFWCVSRHVPFDYTIQPHHSLDRWLCH